MRLKKGVNKKAQTEVGLGTMLLLILGAIALVVIIIGITMGFGEFFGLLGFLPDDLTTMATACAGYVDMNLRGDYCTFREGRIGGVKGWYNCDFVHNKSIEILAEEPFVKMTGWCAAEAPEVKCRALKAEKEARYTGGEIVNGETCIDLGVPREATE